MPAQIRASQQRRKARFIPAPWSIFKFPWKMQRKRAKKRALISHADIGKLRADIRDGAHADAESRCGEHGADIRDGAHADAERGTVPSEGPPSDLRCEVCESSTEDQLMLLCDGCDKGYHTRCLLPPLESVPENDWFCPVCSPNPHLPLQSGTEVISWNKEFHELVTQMVTSESGLDALREAMTEWDVAKLKALVADWDASTLATVLDDFPSHKAAALLADANASKVTLLCDLWDVGAVRRLLPKLRTKIARAVLSKLYFQSDDPHFTRQEVKRILECFDEKKRAKLTKLWPSRIVRRVMESGSSRQGGGSVYDDDSEDSDVDEEEDETLDGFIVPDGEDDDDEGEEDEEEEEE